MKMKKLLMVLAFSIVLSVTGFAGKSFAATTYVGSVDTNGDGVIEHVYDDYNAGTFTITDNNGGNARGYWIGTGWSAVSFVETNGVAGAEIVVTYPSGGVSIIDDRARTTRGYWVGSGFSLVSQVETNGVAGTEMVYVFPSGGVAIIDDRAQTIRGYYPGPGWTAVSYYNQDGQPGTEIVFTYGTFYLKTVVNDRLQSMYGIY